MRAIILRLMLTACASLLLSPVSFAQTPPVAPPGSVTLPLVDYDKLVDRAAHPPAPAERPPVAAVVARADLQVRVSAAGVHGTATLQGEVLSEGRVRVPLVDRTPTIALLDAQQAGAPVPIVTEGGTMSAILSGRGPFTLTLAFGSDVTSEPGRASALLPAMWAGTVRATIEAPGDNADVRVAEALIGSRSSSAGKTVVEVTLQPRVLSLVYWSSREQAVRTLREARLVTDVKTLVTVAEADLRLASLFDVNVLQGEPEQLDLQVPDGYEVVSVSGGSVESAGQQQGGRLTLAIRERARQRHQFLVTLERTIAGGIQHADLALPGVQGAQRETGEVAWEAVGTIDLTATEAGPLRRLDVSEVNASLSALARSPLLAAFRYQRRGDERVPVAFDVRRFADAPVLGAAAEDATVTTLVSSEGRALTEFMLRVRNRGQLFLKVGLPKGATLLSAEVEGQPVKPVDAPDGARVPLTRPGFRPAGPYTVSFVYVESGSSFGRKGDAEMKLPRMDLPLEALHWEVFLPERYKVKRFEGDAMPDTWIAPPAAPSSEPVVPHAFRRTGVLRPGQLGGVAIDTSGAVLPGATVEVVQGSYRQSQVTTGRGEFLFSGVPSGPVTITVELMGFRSFTTVLPGAGVSVEVPLQVAGVQESVRVMAQQPGAAGTAAFLAPSQNVVNLQQRVSGVLPVRIDVPRNGQSFRFVRPLVLDEETALRFEYKMR